MRAETVLQDSCLQHAYSMDIRPSKRRELAARNDTANSVSHVETEHILTSGRWYQLDLPSFCTGCNYRLLRAKIPFNRNLEKNLCHRARRKTWLCVIGTLWMKYYPNFVGKLRKTRPKSTSCLSKNWKIVARNCLSSRGKKIVSHLHYHYEVAREVNEIEGWSLCNTCNTASNEC